MEVKNELTYLACDISFLQFPVLLLILLKKKSVIREVIQHYKLHSKQFLQFSLSFWFLHKITAIVLVFFLFLLSYRISNYCNSKISAFQIFCVPTVLPLDEWTKVVGLDTKTGKTWPTPQHMFQIKKN